MTERFEVYMNRKGPPYAQQDITPKKDDGGSGTQPGLRQEGGDPAEGGEGVQPGRPEPEGFKAKGTRPVSEEFAGNVMIIGLLVVLLVTGGVFWWMYGKGF